MDFDLSDDEVTELSEPKPTLNNSHSIIDLDGKVSPAILSSIFDCNISLIYQESQKGRLPPVVKESTYRECIQMYVQHFKKKQDLAIEKEKLKAAAPSRRGRAGQMDNPDIGADLMIAKTKQEIRLNMARETQLWVKASIDRGEYISLEKLEEIVEPFISTIRQVFLTIALESPEIEKQVDLAMEQLYAAGVNMLAEATEDKKKFIQDITTKELDLASIQITDASPEIL